MKLFSKLLSLFLLCSLPLNAGKSALPSFDTQSEVEPADADYVSADEGFDDENGDLDNAPQSSVIGSCFQCVKSVCTGLIGLGVGVCVGGFICYCVAERQNIFDVVSSVISPQAVTWTVSLARPEELFTKAFAGFSQERLAPYFTLNSSEVFSNNTVFDTRLYDTCTPQANNTEMCCVAFDNRNIGCCLLNKYQKQNSCGSITGSFNETVSSHPDLCSVVMQFDNNVNGTMHYPCQEQSIYTLFRRKKDAQYIFDEEIAYLSANKSFGSELEIAPNHASLFFKKYLEHKGEFVNLLKVFITPHCDQDVLVEKIKGTVGVEASLRIGVGQSRLDDQEIKGILAHEAGHVVQSSFPFFRVSTIPFDRLLNAKFNTEMHADIISVLTMESAYPMSSFLKKFIGKEGRGMGSVKDPIKTIVDMEKLVVLSDQHPSDMTRIKYMIEIEKLYKKLKALLVQNYQAKYGALGAS
jgi:hypothetical protein